jgi:two-component system cell cycle response regulator CtrA
MNVDNAIATLREKSGQANELQRLRDRVEELEELLGIVSKDVVDPLSSLGLASTETRILNCLNDWNVVRRKNLWILLYSGRREDEQPDMKVLDVYVSKLRKRMSPFGIEVATLRAGWGTGNDTDGGWFMTQQNKEKLRALVLGGNKIR